VRPSPGRASGRRRLSILSRVLAAVLGGYGLAALTSVLSALFLPAARSEAVLAGILAGFAVWLVAALWVFAASSALRAWAGLALPAAGLSLVCLSAGGGLP
jgi:Na+/proline symporter